MSVNKVNSDGSLKRIAGGTLYADAPLGTILAFGGTTAPAGWMLCQGQTISRTTYAKLFAIIGTTFGTGDGSTTFNIPDLRGEFLRGVGTNSHANQGSGGNLGEHQDATGFAAPVSGRNYSDIYDLASGNKGYKNPDTQINTTLNGYSRTDHNQNLGGSAYVISFRPTNTSVNYIIKVMMVSLPTDLDAGVDNKLDARFAGMKIVRKTFSNRSFTANTDTNFDLSDILADVDDLIDFSIMVYQTNSSYYKLPYFSGGPQLYCNAISASRVATIHCGSVAWPASYYVTFTLYIKA